MSISKICHLADIHIRKSPSRNEEYQLVFDNLIKSLQQEKPDRIVLVGDLVNDYLHLEGEQLILANKFLNDLADIAPVRITRGNHDCYTGDHEVLTKQGWISLKNYVDNDYNCDVLSFNEKKNSFEFETPSSLISKQYRGELKEIITHKNKMVVTPTHEVLLKKYSTNQFIKSKAHDIQINSDLRIPVCSNENILERNLWFELLGFCLADATFVVRNEITKTGRIQFHLKKERKIEYLINLLNQLGIRYTLNDGDKKRGTKKICIYSDIAKKIINFFPNKKILDWDLLTYDKIELKSFIDGYLNGDGCNTEYELYRCVTIHKTNAEILVAMAQYVGYYSHTSYDGKGNYENSKKQFGFTINKNNNHSSIIKEINNIKYEGNVYCLTVPSENLFIRYYGNTFIGGNCRKKNIKRVDSVEAIVKTLNNPDVIYYDKTGFHLDDNVYWVVWHHGDVKTNPWNTKEGKKITPHVKNNSFTYIDLFHDPINGCVSDNGIELKSKIYFKLSDFKGNYGFFGDIHKMQYLDKDKTKAYSGSLIAQKFTEGDDDFHGYLLWDIESGTVEEKPIDNEYSFKNVVVNPYTDFDDLDFEIDNPTKHMRVRFVWATLPQTRNKENERRLSEYLKNKYVNVTISHTNQFIENTDIVINDKISLKNINDTTVQHEIFKDYFEKIGVESSVIDDVIKLDGEILKSIEIVDDSGIEWDIVKFGGTNFMSYEQIDIDWRKLEGLFQITGINTAGKTTILKLVSYLLFGKTLETESRKKFGDSRYVNNRNGATSTNAYCVIEANGEYYGIKRNTVLEFDKNKEIKGAPTTLNYYILSDPDEEMTDDNLVENLNEDQRKETQKKINGIINNYDNFKRIVLTTSDTLNEILKNEMADFIDSLLFDSGLDIFDKKLEAVKNHAKEINNKGRVSCNVETTNVEITKLKVDITALEAEIKDIEDVKIVDVRNKIKIGKDFVEEHTKKLYKIDPEITGLNVEQAKIDIKTHEAQIVKLETRKTVIEGEIKLLKESYDEKRLTELLEKKESHRVTENKHKFEIKNLEKNISDEEHKIEIINGDIFRLKQDGAKLKQEAIDLKNSKNCPTCGQKMTEEHIEHVSKLIEKKTKEIYGVVDKMKVKETERDVPNKEIMKFKDEIRDKMSLISSLTTEMEEILIEIGTLTNEKNDVEKRKTLQIELGNIPSKIENEELKISILKNKIQSRENSLKQIEENKINQQKIDNGKARLHVLEAEIDDLVEDGYIKKTSIAEKQLKIKNAEILIAEFKTQEYEDMVITLYKKCVHRDGIPKQMLANYIVPNINLTLETILSSTQFKVWLDPDDFRPKLVYNNRPTSIIDCIGACGKERTFAAIVLKFALNQVNVKSKPMFFFLDEVMGKLSEDSIEEFIEILQLIKNNMKRVLIIEHNHEISPNWLINVTVDEDGISSLELE